MKKNSYSYDDLISCGNGELFGPGNAKLPLPPMLMFDRITEINDDKGAYNKGVLKAELDIKKNLWFFTQRIEFVMKNRLFPMAPDQFRDE